MSRDTRANRRYRSQEWFDNPNNPGMTALYLERYQNQSFTQGELQAERSIIGIAQTGSDLVPCNKIHVFLMDRIKAGIRDAGGIPMEFPVHPIQETGKRPTAALDRNLQYLSLVEVLHGYPIDGVVLTTGCDKTTPAMLMGAATVDLPALALNGGPMLDGWYKGRRAGSGTTIWEGRRMLARGEIGYEEFMELACASSPSLGHCNTMGTASTMNALAEALGMALPGAAAIPAPFRERMGTAYRGHGGGGPETLRHPHPRGLPERDQGQYGDRRLHQRAAAPAGDRAACGRGARRHRLADPWPRPAASGEPAAGGRIPWRKLFPRGRGAGRDGRTSGGGAARRRGTDGDGAADAGGHRRRAQQGQGCDPALRRPVARRGGVSRAVRKSLRQRADEDLRHLGGVSHAVPQGRHLRGACRGLRRTRGLPRACQRPGARDRREKLPLHPQRGLRGLSGLGRGGEHAAAR